MWTYNYTPEPNELYHWGIKGMKWGVRRYQNKDGTLTPLGKKRLKEDGSFKSDKEYRKEISDEEKRVLKSYKKKYGVDKAFEDADISAAKRFEKLGYIPDMDDEEFGDDVAKLYDKAYSLERKAHADMKADMTKKYGGDYTKLKDRETTQTGMIIAGGILATAAVTVGVGYGVVAGTKAAAKGIFNIGAKAVDKIIGR